LRWLMAFTCIPGWFSRVCIEKTNILIQGSKGINWDVAFL
jgi:hypothetical protein